MTIKLACVTKEAKQNYAVVLKAAMIIIGPIIIVYGLWEITGMFGEVSHPCRLLNVIAAAIILFTILAIDCAYAQEAPLGIKTADHAGEAMFLMVLVALIPYGLCGVAHYLGYYPESPLPSAVGFIIATGVVIPLACAVSKCRYQKKGGADE